MSRRPIPDRAGSRRPSRPLLVTVAALLAVVVLVAGCGDDAATEAGAPSTTSPPPDDSGSPDGSDDSGSPDGSDDTVPPAGCDTGDWNLVDMGDFTFRVPADLADQEAQGIDSLVGEFSRPGMTLGFDYGWYSPTFDDLAAAGATATAVTVDGHPGTLVQADLRTLPDREGMWFVALHVPDLGESDDTAVGATSLALWIDYDDEADLDEATCIIETVAFA